MGKKHFSEEQIAFALRQAESGTSVAEIIRKLGISEQSFCRWKKRFAGLGIAELRRLRIIEEENQKLKQLIDWRRCCADRGAGAFTSWQAADDPCRRRPGLHLEARGSVGLLQWRDARLQQTRKAHG
jgi:putative transposase